VLRLGLPLLSLFVSAAHAEAPSWAVNDAERLEGTRYQAACSGEGPSVGLARQEAIDSCRVSAAQHLPSEITVKSISITSETDGAYHQEVLKRASVTGLVCVPRRERVQETSISVKVWVLCDFDLSRARMGGTPALAGERGAQGRERRVLTLAVVPACSSVIVRGESPARIVRCDRNPMSVLLEPGDSEVLVRAKGRLPKSLPIKARWAKKGREYARVVLDPAG
jgi:hypothetical protein